MAVLLNAVPHARRMYATARCREAARVLEDQGIDTGDSSAEDQAGTADASPAAPVPKRDATYI